MAKRMYNESYIKFGFTSLNDHGTEKGQCVVCYCVLSNESLRPSKLSNHLEKKHLNLRIKARSTSRDWNLAVNVNDLTQLKAFNKVIGNLQKHPLLLAK